jgi:hypothetical protein
MSWKDELDNDYKPPKFGGMDGEMWAFMALFALLLAGGLWYTVAAWTPDNEGAKKILQEEGYSEIEITGADPLKCGSNDFGGTTFRAKNQAGNTVTGVVCCGRFFKGCTIRR